MESGPSAARFPQSSAGASRMRTPAAPSPSSPDLFCDADQGFPVQCSMKPEEKSAVRIRPSQGVDSGSIGPNDGAHTDRYARDLSLAALHRLSIDRHGPAAALVRLFRLPILCLRAVHPEGFRCTVRQLQRDYAQQTQALLQTGVIKRNPDDPLIRYQDDAEMMALYTEFAIDFATQSMRYALMAALRAAELQIQADTCTTEGDSNDE